MTKSPQEQIIAVLIHKLGGDVTISPLEWITADGLELTRWDDPSTLGMRFTAKFPPVELVGELVDEQRELEARG